MSVYVLGYIISVFFFSFHVKRRDSFRTVKEKKNEPLFHSVSLLKYVTRISLKNVYRCTENVVIVAFFFTFNITIIAPDA